MTYCEETGPEICPECGRDLSGRELTRPGRSPLIVKSCWYCGAEATEEGAPETRAQVTVPICVGAIF